MPDERVRDEFVGGEWEGLERRVEIGDAVLDEQADEVQAADGEFPLGSREDGTANMRRYEQRTYMTVRRGLQVSENNSSPIVIVERL